MGTDENILKHQLDHGIFDNAQFHGTEGIARKAIDEGISTLSPRQRSVLDPYLSNHCSGVTDPGGHHNGCSKGLKGEELLEAYLRSEDSEFLLCESCESDKGYHAHQWDRISRE
ncbi:hypothetical protein [Vreelandella malpeensis]|uniref:Uncharacterized protein n=1 Tax=Vreelandella malpeensis TaxID=1172368 RepID=A0ABS8DVN6_9GAMM|nr:hypothetical protein [Halomonas malpeensis]MCB8889910.1 hypothetical protein [Halomonas malpeensis]